MEYTIRRSSRARQVRLSVSCDAGVVLTVPRFTGIGRAEDFIRQKAGWLIKTLNFARSRPKRLSLAELGLTRFEARAKAHSLALERLEHWNQFYKFPYNRVAVKFHKARWGSCSRLGNLNFNYKIIFLPANLADYIIVHELCHLREMNHSYRFWNLVARAIPDHKECRRQLRQLFY